VTLTRNTLITRSFLDMPSVVLGLMPNGGTGRPIPTRTESPPPTSKNCHNSSTAAPQFLDRRPALQRAASYTYLSSLQHEFAFQSPSLTRSFSDDVLSSLNWHQDQGAEQDSSPDRTPRASPGRANPASQTAPQDYQELPASSKPLGRPQITISKFIRPVENAMPDASYQSRPARKISKRNSLLDLKSRGVSDSFASFARRSWISSPSTSRSASPSSKEDDSSRDEDDTTAASSVSSCSPGEGSPIGQKAEMSLKDSPKKMQPKRTAVLQRKQKRPVSMMGPVDSTASDGLVFTSSAFPFTKSSSSDRLHRFRSDPPRKRDELWTTFRSLESDFHKYVQVHLTLALPDLAQAFL